MNLEGIRDALRRQPFLSFSISLADGRSFDIRHPEFVVVGPRLVTVIVDEDTWSVIDPILIASLDYMVGDSSLPRGRRQPQ